MDGGKDYRFAATGGWSDGMRKSKNKTEMSYLEMMKEAAEKYGVKVTDMSERGIRAIGFLSGVGSQDQGQISRTLRLSLAGLSHK